MASKINERMAFAIEALWISGRTVAEIAAASKMTRGAVSGFITRNIPNRSDMTADQRHDRLIEMKADRRDGGLLDRFDWIARSAVTKKESGR